MSSGLPGCQRRPEYRKCLDSICRTHHVPRPPLSQHKINHRKQLKMASQPTGWLARALGNCRKLPEPGRQHRNYPVGFTVRPSFKNNPPRFDRRHGASIASPDPREAGSPGIAAQKASSFSGHPCIVCTVGGTTCPTPYISELRMPSIKLWRTLGASADSEKSRAASSIVFPFR